MKWKTETPSVTDIPDAEVPPELVEGLERHREGATFLRARLRWRPYDSDSTGFLTNNRLLDVEDDSTFDIARALASRARHLLDQGLCEDRFEAQIRRQLVNEDGQEAREWRSITFYIRDAVPEPEPPPEPELDDDEVEDEPADEAEDDEPDEPDEEPRWRPPPRPPGPGRAHRQGPPQTPSPEPGLGAWGKFGRYIELSRTDPTAFAMLVLHESREREVSTLERLLDGSASRLDRVLATQISNTRAVNQTLQILTRGSSEIASVGVQLFKQGLQGRAHLAQVENDAELGKERTELMRDAVKQGSLLIQAIMMSQAGKNQTQAPPQDPGASASAPPPPSAGAEQGPPPGKSSADLEIEKAAQALLALVDEPTLDQVRGVAPNLVGIFDELRSQPVDGARIRAVITRAQREVDMNELDEAAKFFPPELKAAFGRLMVLVLM